MRIKVTWHIWRLRGHQPRVEHRSECQLRAVLAFVVAPFSASAFFTILLCVRQYRLRQLRKRRMYTQPDLD